jgi:hypothetical protein
MLLGAIFEAEFKKINTIWVMCYMFLTGIGYIITISIFKSKYFISRRTRGWHFNETAAADLEATAKQDKEDINTIEKGAVFAAPFFYLHFITL